MRPMCNGPKSEDGNARASHKKMGFMYITTRGLENGRNIIMDIRELPIREIDEGLRVN